MSQSTPVELREWAEDILARPEFGEPGEPWPERVFRWLGDRFNSLFDGLGASGWVIWRQEPPWYARGESTSIWSW